MMWGICVDGEGPHPGGAGRRMSRTIAGSGWAYAQNLEGVFDVSSGACCEQDRLTLGEMPGPLA